MTRRHIIFHILVVAALFALPVVVRSFTVNDIQQYSQDAQCAAQNINNIVNQFNSLYNTDLRAKFKQEFVDAVQTYWPQLLECIIGSFTTYGTGVAGARDCPNQIGDKAQTAIQDQYERKFEADLITDCAAQTDIRAVLNAARRILMENGRDGGAAFVKDWRAFQADNRYRGLQIARNQMANTRHCSWVSGQLQGLFGFSPANAVPPMSGYEDGQDSYTRDAACSLGDDFNPAAARYQTAEAFAAMMLPQNNIWGSYLLAQEEIRQQIADEEQAAQNEFVNTGGIGALRAINPATGTSCAVMAADGSACLQYSHIENPAAGVVAEIQAQRQALYDLVTNPRTTEEVANDVRANLVSTFMSMTQPLAQLQYSRGGTAGRSGGNTPTPTPTPTDVPGSGDPGDPICTGGIPSCNCAVKNPSAQGLATGPVLTATQAVIAAHPEWISTDGALLQGQNVPFLQAVCQNAILSGIGSCRPNNAGFGLVLSISGMEFNIDVILASNVVRQPGMTTVVCTTPGNL